MDRHLFFVSLEFRIVGGLMALLSLALLAFGIWVYFVTGPEPHPEVRYATHGYGIFGWLQNEALLLGKAFRFFGGLSHWLAGIVIALAAVATTVSTGLFLTGRGIAQHAAWARGMGMLIAVMIVLSSVGGILAQHRIGSPLGLVLFAGSVYAIWVLGWRYS